MKWQLDNAGISLIENFEGLRLNAYQDTAGVWTIGYGCTYYPGGKHVQKGDGLINEPVAKQLLKNVVAAYEAAVNSLVKVSLNQNQYNALVSFTYNEGIGALQTSTLLKKLNAGDYAGAADQFPLWDKITKNGQKEVCDTLVKRRAKERETFLN